MLSWFLSIILIQKIAEVVEASIEDYEEGMKACSEAAKLWIQVWFYMLLDFMNFMGIIILEA